MFNYEGSLSTLQGYLKKRHCVLTQRWRYFYNSHFLPPHLGFTERNYQHTTLPIWSWMSATRVIVSLLSRLPQDLQFDTTLAYISSANYNFWSRWCRFNPSLHHCQIPHSPLSILRAHARFCLCCDISGWRVVKKNFNAKHIADDILLTLVLRSKADSWLSAIVSISCARLLPVWKVRIE